MDKELLNIISNFKDLGEDFVVGGRNLIKIIPYKGDFINIKSFKIPNLLNGVIYNFFRKSKARRSFEHAKILEQKGIGTPKPIAFYENKTWLRLKDSYYISEHITPDFTFRELIENNKQGVDEVLIELGKFCFTLHQNGIEFLDHSPGNTLIKQDEKGNCQFYLVDLNRMKFHKNMSFHQRMKNLSRLTPTEHHIKFISKGYAQCYNKSEDEIFEVLWRYTTEFQKRYLKKHALKQKIKL